MQHPQIMFKSPYFLLGLILLVILLGMQVKFCRLHKPVVGSITCTSHCLGNEDALLHLGNRPKKIAPNMYLTPTTKWAWYDSHNISLTDPYCPCNLNNSLRNCHQIIHCKIYSQLKMQQFSPTTDKDLYVFHRSTAASIYLFPSMTSMRSSAVASYLRVMSALAMRYSLKMDLTESMSSSDWVHCDKKTKTEYWNWKCYRLHCPFTCQVYTEKKLLNRLHCERSLLL